MESAAASAFLKSVMGRLFLLLEKEYNKHKGLAQEIQSIQQDLRMIAAAMDDRLLNLGLSHRTAVARLYTEEMLDLSHDIEDCVDRFMHRLSCKQQATSLVKRVAHKLKKVQSRSSFADEIIKLKKRLKAAHQRVTEAVPLACGGQPNGLPPSVVASSKPSPCRIACNPVGIQKPMEDLVSLLDEVDGEPHQLRVISIVGFGGLGKTTLARAVYDSPHARERFQCFAWVASTGDSPEFSDRIVGILRNILQQVLPGETMDVDSNNLEASLTEYLKDKRYLILIDDIRMDEWSTIDSAFQDNGTSSRIILTTTIQSVANKCSHGNGYVYQMETLGEDDSKKIAFPGVRSPELEHGSAALLGKCDGLPLALVSVSDYLKSSAEPTGELCAKLCRNLGSHLKEKHGHDNFSDLRKVLLDNYDNLSGYALTCLLYLGIFPNNRPLKKKVVTRRWLAEGYARSESLCSEQDTADENFNKLVNRNVIQPIETRNNAQVKTFRSHGIMHEFVLHKSFSQRFIGKLSRDHPRISVNASNARHLSIHAGELTECVATEEEDLSRVRSLTVFGEAGGAISYVRKCKLIRVLDLEECKDLEQDDLKLICKLWHLKYLSFGDTVSALPRSIEGLHCLETLDLRRTKIKSLPVEAIQLPHLTHLFGNIMIDKEDLNDVKKMSKLQKFLSGKKSNLQTLAGFVTDDRKGFLQIMGQMNKLRKVKIWCKRAASSTYTSDLAKAIQEFAMVPMDRDSDRSLSLDSNELAENFLSSLDFEACYEGYKYDIRSLKLHGKLLHLPHFATSLPGLTELCISSHTLTRDLLPGLLSLRRLLYIKLTADQLENFEIKHGALPSLRRLCFVVRGLTSAMPTIEQGALPNLVSLQLICRGLVGLSGIEIRHFKRLKEVTINVEVTEGTAQVWEQAARNHPNRPRVVFTKMTHPMENDEPGPCALSEKRKRSASQPSLDDRLELDSSLKKMRLSETSSRLQVVVHPVVVAAGTVGSSSIPVRLHADESGSWIQQPGHH